MNKRHRDKSSRCLKALLEGKTINRKILGDMGIGINNDSAHSYISYLRNERLIPVESNKILDDTCDYFMTPLEIHRYKDPTLRLEQQEEVRLTIERERQKRLITKFSRFLEKLSSSPELWGFWDDLPFVLGEIVTEINALLNR